MTNLDTIFKSRDITLPTKVRLVKAMVFPVLMYGCESWTMKKVECWRIDDFELWCWRRLLWVPWTARRSNQSILKETSPGCSLEWLMLRLKRPWCWEGLGAGGEGDDRGWDGWMASPTRCIWVWVNSGNWWWTGRPGMLRFMGSQRVGHNWVTDLTDWTDSQINKYLLKTTRSVSKQSKHIEKGRSPGEGNGNPLQYSYLENSMDRGAWWAAVYGVTKSWTQLSDWTELNWTELSKAYDFRLTH